MSNLQCTVESVGHKFPLQCQWAATAIFYAKAHWYAPYSASTISHAWKINLQLPVDPVTPFSLELNR